MLLESRLEFVKKSLGETPIDTSHDLYALHRDNASIVDYLASHDPSNGKKYTAWMVTRYKNHAFRQEDAAVIGEHLRFFDKHKHKFDVKDINKHTIRTLRSDVARVREKYGEGTNREKEQEVDKAGREKLFDDGNLQVYHLKTKDASQQIYGGGSYSGRATGTDWCTAARSAGNMFDYYTKNGGKLFTIHKADDERSPYQLHTSGQFMDRYDGEADPFEVIPPSHPARKTLGVHHPLLDDGTHSEMHYDTGDRNLQKYALSSEHEHVPTSLLYKAITSSTHDMADKASKHPNMSSEVIDKILDHGDDAFNRSSEYLFQAPHAFTKAHHERIKQISDPTVRYRLLTSLAAVDSKSKKPFMSEDDLREVMNAPPNVRGKTAQYNLNIDDVVTHKNFTPKLDAETLSKPYDGFASARSVISVLSKNKKIAPEAITHGIRVHSQRESGIENILPFFATSPKHLDDIHHQMLHDVGDKNLAYTHAQAEGTPSKYVNMYLKGPFGKEIATHISNYSQPKSHIFNNSEIVGNLVHHLDFNTYTGDEERKITNIVSAPGFTDEHAQEIGRKLSTSDMNFSQKTSVHGALVRRNRNLPEDLVRQIHEHAKESENRRYDGPIERQIISDLGIQRNMPKDVLDQMVSSPNKRVRKSVANNPNLKSHHIKQLLSGEPDYDTVSNLAVNKVPYDRADFERLTDLTLSEPKNVLAGVALKLREDTPQHLKDRIHNDLSPNATYQSFLKTLTRFNEME